MMMMRAAVTGGWQFWSCCGAVCRDGVPCGRPAAIWPASPAPRRCLSHGGRNGEKPAARPAAPPAPVTPGQQKSGRTEREKARRREYRRACRAKEREQKAAARPLGSAS